MLPPDQRRESAHVPFAELPFAGDTGMRHSWDVFGRDDGLGTLNFLTPARRRAALAAARTGDAVRLSLPLDRPDPPPFGRVALQHEVQALNSFSWDDRITRMDLQASTQWDGLMHVGHRDHGLYGGHPDPTAGAPHIGIDQWAAGGIVGRGVLVDVEAHFAAAGFPYDPVGRTPVEPEHLASALAAQGTALRPGDVLCLRFGWHRGLAAHPADAQDGLMMRPACAGLRATEDTARFLWDHEVAALVADNPTVEVQPGDRDEGFLHQRLLTMLGMPLGELFDLDGLAEACRARGAWDFLFVSVPLNLPGGIGSPGNAVAFV